MVVKALSHRLTDEEKEERKKYAIDLRDWRDTNGFTQQELSDWLGMPVKTYIKQESEGGVHSKELLDKVEAADPKKVRKWLNQAYKESQEKADREREAAEAQEVEEKPAKQERQLVNAKPSPSQAPYQSGKAVYAMARTGLAAWIENDASDEIIEALCAWKSEHGSK